LRPRRSTGLSPAVDQALREAGLVVQPSR